MKYKINKGLITQKLDGKITIFDGDESTLLYPQRNCFLYFLKNKTGLGEEETDRSFSEKIWNQ